VCTIGTCSPADRTVEGERIRSNAVFREGNSSDNSLDCKCRTNSRWSWIPIDRKTSTGITLPYQFSVLWRERTGPHLDFHTDFHLERLKSDSFPGRCGFFTDRSEEACGRDLPRCVPDLYRNLSYWKPIWFVWKVWNGNTPPTGNPSWCVWNVWNWNTHGGRFTGNISSVV